MATASSISGNKEKSSWKLKEWCKHTLCYCSLLYKSDTHDAGDVNHPTSTQDIAETKRKGSQDSHVTDSHDNHMTEPTESCDNHETKISRENSLDILSPPSPRRKSVTFLDSQSNVDEYQEDSDRQSDVQSPRQLSRQSKLENQYSRESQLDDIPVELASIEARLTELLGNTFFKTVDEVDSDEVDYSDQDLDQPWGHLEFKLQVTEDQLSTKIADLEERTRDVEQKISLKYAHGNLPYDITLDNYVSLRRRKVAFCSPPMYTHPGGYKFRLEIWPGGEGMSEGTHLAINVISLKGNYDTLIKFPVSFIVTIQILNRYIDQSHYQRDIECVYQDSGNKNEIGSEFEFILEDNLYWREEKKTQFLVNEEIKLRVTKIVFI